MKKITLTLTALGSTFILLLFAAPAHAQATRTWVSGVGDDVNPCSRTAPCKTFAGAISKTAINGEINALDPGAYGTLTITKSISVDCHDVLCGVLNISTNGFLVNIAAGNANDPLRVARIRNVNIHGGGVSGSVGSRLGLNGVRIDSALQVSLEDMHITDQSQRGIFEQRATGGKLTVNNTILRNCTLAGIVSSPSAGSTRIDITLDRVIAEGNGVGMAFNNGAKAMLHLCVSTNNVNSGIESTAAAGTTEVTVDRSVSSSNNTGLLQSGGGLMRIADTDVAFNKLNGTSGTIASFSNSRFTGNAGASSTSPIGAAVAATGQQ